jgi:hypothetical protein
MTKSLARIWRSDMSEKRERFFYYQPTGDGETCLSERELDEETWRFCVYERFHFNDGGHIDVITAAMKNENDAKMFVSCGTTIERSAI